MRLGKCDEVGGFPGFNGTFSIQDGRLRSGDQILQIGHTDLYGMSSGQVARVLRQCGNHVRLLIARATPDDPTPASGPALPTVAEQQVSAVFSDGPGHVHSTWARRQVSAADKTLLLCFSFFCPKYICSHPSGVKGIPV